MPRTPDPDDWKDEFYKALRSLPSISAAARACGRNRQYLYKLRDQDPEFARQWDEALAEGVDRIEEEAMKRGVEGVQRPIYQRGELVGYQTEYSDHLLSRVLSARHPDYKPPQPVGTLNQGPTTYHLSVHFGPAPAHLPPGQVIDSTPIDQDTPEGEDRSTDDDRTR